MKNERIELFIYVNVINKSKATYGLYLKYYDKNNLFVMDKKVSSQIIQYKKIEEVVYNSLIEGLKLIKNRNVQVIVYSSFDGSYKRQDELTKLVKKFYKINFIFNYEDEVAKLISKENFIKLDNKGGIILWS